MATQITTFEAMALCHPDRRMYRKRDGACLECVVDQHRAKEHERHPEKRLERVDLTPRRVPGVKHFALTRMPDACPKCGCRLLMVEGRRVFCPGVRGGCGSDWYLVAE